MRVTKDLGILLLAIWLILTGALPVLKITFPSSALLLQLLAVAAGVLLLLKR